MLLVGNVAGQLMTEWRIGPLEAESASSIAAFSSSRRTPVVRHVTCCLARRRLQYRVLMKSAVFFSLVPSHSQLREALAITATSGSRSFCGHFSSSGLSHSRLGRALWARNEGFV